MLARRFIIISAISLLAGLIAGLLPADAVAAPDDALKQKAQQMLTEGNSLAAEGDFGAALVKFRTAYELYPSPKLLLNIGTSLRHVGRYAEAVVTYETYIAHPDADPGRVDELRDILDDLDRVTGKLKITVEESDVKVSLDGKLLRDIGQHALLRVDPGRHTVVAEKPGRQPSIVHVDVKQRQTKEVILALAEPGKEPDTPVSVQRIAGWGLVGLGSAGIVAGAVLGAVAQSKRSDADDLCASEGHFSGYCSPEGAELNDDARTFGGAATILFVGGFGLGIAGFALAFTADDETEETVALTLGPGPGLGLVMTW